MTTSDRAPADGIVVRYRIRFDECNPEGVARTATLLRYAQDVAWIHSERLGFDRAWYAARGLAWVVRCAEIGVLRPVPLAESIDVSTAVTGFRRVWARRRSEVRLADGSLAAWVHADWVLLDGRGTPGRLPAELLALFRSRLGTFEPGRVPLPPTPPDVVTWRSTVRSGDLDPMAHVNNAAYVDYLEEAILAAGPPGAAAIAAIPREIRLEYLMPAAPSATLAGAVWPARSGEGRAGWAWRLVDGHDRELARGRLTSSPATT